MHCTELPASPQRDDKELEKRSLPPASTVSEPADPSQSSSRQPETSSLPQVKSEPAVSSPVKSTNIPNLPSSQTTNVRVKQPPADDINALGLEPSVVNALSGPGLIQDVLKTAFHSMMQQFLADEFAGTNIVPSLLNLSNQNASQTSNTSTNVNREPSAKPSSHPSSLAANVNVRRRVKRDSKKSNVTLVDALPSSAVATVKVECPKVDLSEELENDLIEITDVPPVAPAATDEAVDKVSRRKSNNNVNELTKKRPTSPKPIAKSSREDETDKYKSCEAIINLCNANEGADDVIEISDEESGSQPRRSRQNRKNVDPITIVIEDTQDNEEKSKNLEPFFDKPVLTTAPAPAKAALSSEPKVDFSKQIVPHCMQKVEVAQPVSTTPVEPPPSNQPKAGLQQSNVSASVEHSSSIRSKVELPQPVELDPVEDPPCNMQQMQFAPATVTTLVKPTPSDRQKILFQQPIINTPKEHPSIDKPISGFPQLKVEPCSKPDVVLQEPISDAPAESSTVRKETVMLEEVIPTKSPLTDVPPTSSFTDLYEDRKPLALVKCEPVAAGNYSNLDEIIALDSDDEDFPLSQLNTTLINDMPDFSSSFERMFDDGEYVKEEPQVLQCNENTWFEPFSQTEMVEGKHVARIQLSTLESDDAMTEKELQSILDEEPDGVVQSELEEADDKMDVDEEPSLSKPSAHVNDFDVNQQPQSSDWRSVVKRKYHLKECSVRLTDAKPLGNRWSRKAQKEEEEEKRRSSSSFDEALRGLNEEPVKNATTKKRHAQPSPHKVRKRKRRTRSPTMTVQEKRLIKEKRKEKLKEIVPKTNETETKWKDAFRPDAKPVVKVTNKNRGSFLIDAMIKEASLPKRPLKVEHSTKEPSLPKRDKPSKSEPSTLIHQINPKDGAQRLPVLKEKVVPSNNLRSNDAKLMEKIMDQYCKDDVKPGPSRRGSISEPEENAFANALNRITFEAKEKLDTRKDSESQRKSSNSSASRRDSHNYQKFKSSVVPSRSRKPKKSSLKKTPVIYGPTNIYDPPKPKKKVRFHREEDCQIIPWDALERRNNGIFAPAYKLNENLIREGITEFETAMAKVCSWNVKWLEVRSSLWYLFGI